ncbi:MAG: transcription antitermination factor NusB [Planctomycetota bacterium]
MSTTARDIRRLAFQALFQLDAMGDAEPDTVRASVETMNAEADHPLAARDARRAFDLALAAFRERRAADAMVAELAPTWPAHRQPAADRAILRLAIHEMTSGRTGAKIAVNEAIELAKRFSTDRSPAFVNGVLDKVLKQVLAAQSNVGVDATGGEVSSG